MRISKNCAVSLKLMLLFLALLFYNINNVLKSSRNILIYRVFIRYYIFLDSHGGIGGGVSKTSGGLGGGYGGSGAGGYGGSSAGAGGFGGSGSGVHGDGGYGGAGSNAGSYGG